MPALCGVAHSFTWPAPAPGMRACWPCSSLLSLTETEQWHEACAILCDAWLRKASCHRALPRLLITTCTVWFGVGSGFGAERCHGGSNWRRLAGWFWSDAVAGLAGGCARFAGDCVTVLSLLQPAAGPSVYRAVQNGSTRTMPRWRVVCCALRLFARIMARTNVRLLPSSLVAYARRSVACSGFLYKLSACHIEKIW